MQQAINTFFQLHKCPVVGKVANFSLDNRVGRITFGNFVPGILCSLFHSERELLPFLVNRQNDDINFVVDFYEFTGVVDASRPGHLADVYEAFNPGL